MKKIYASMLTLLAAASLSVSAQQLPNNDFSNWKTACGSTDAMGDMRQRPGIEPTDWFGSSVNQKVSGITKTQELLSKDDGVKLENKFVGVSILGKNIGSVAPGYVSLGTPWVYAETNVNNCDGGTYGGLNFSYRPDAIQAMIKRSDSNDEKSHIIVYSWNGTFKSKIGKKGSPTSERNDVDRAIMGTVATESGSTGKLVASVDYAFTTTGSSYTTVTVPLEYKNGETPEKINVIFSAGDYWTRDNMKENTTLYVKNVKFLYYSRLASLSINGNSVADFSADKYDYTIDSEMPDESAFTFTALGNSNSAKTTIELDKANAVAKIIVTNSNANATDIDGATSHTYTLQFNKKSNNDPVSEYGGDVYNGVLNITMAESEFDPINGEVHIISTGANTCTFVLPNFTLPEDVLGFELNLGDIIVENVTVSKDGSDNVYTGFVKDFELADGEIVADINLSGTIGSDGVAHLLIEVLWHMPTDDGVVDVPINVTFNGERALAGIGTVVVDNENAAAEFFNLQGVRIAADNLTPGIYIVRKGSEVKKILVK